MAARLPSFFATLLASAMAFFSSADRPAAASSRLRDRDLDALSDRELEALLFDGKVPDGDDDESGGLLPSSLSGWAGLVVGIALIGALGEATEGAVLVPLLIAGAVYYVAKGGSFSWSCSRSAEASAAPGSSRRLTRSRTDKKLAGVCGGLARYAGVDSTLARLAFIVALFAGGPLAAVCYALLAYALPQAPRASVSPPPSSASEQERLRIIRES